MYNRVWRMSVLGFLLLLFWVQNGWAQSNKASWSLDLAGGIPYTQFTVGTSQFSSPEYGFGLRYNFSPRFALKGDFYRGIFHGNASRDYRSNFYRYGLKPEFYFLRTDNVVFSVFGGLDYVSNDVNVNLKSGLGSTYAGVSRQSNFLMFGAGAAVHLQLSPVFDLVGQVEQHVAGTRSFDGYSQEVTSGGFTFTQTSLDKYVSMMLGLTVKFGAKQRQHQLWTETGTSQQQIERLSSRVAILEKRIEKEDKQIDQLMAELANLRDSLAAVESALVHKPQMVKKHSAMFDSLQADIQQLQSELATAEQEEQQMRQQPEGPTGPYYIIAGSFTRRTNAVSYADQLKEKGMTPAVLPPGDEGSLYKVSFTRGMTREMAQTKLKTRYQQIKEAAWIYRFEGQPINQ